MEQYLKILICDTIFVKRAGRNYFARICAISLFMILPVTPAFAIFLEADHIEADGINSTLDFWFFEFTANTIATIQVNDLGGPPIPGADPDMIIYRDDGTFSNIVAADTSAGSDPFINQFFSAGSYIAVVANNLLSAFDFSPFHEDGLLSMSGYEYELNGPEPENGIIRFNCSLSGNLDGSYTKKIFNGGNDTCSLPIVAVNEPGWLFLAGLIALLASVFRNRGGQTI